MPNEPSENAELQQKMVTLYLKMVELCSRIEEEATAILKDNPTRERILEVIDLLENAKRELGRITRKDTSDNLTQDS